MRKVRQSRKPLANVTRYFGNKRRSPDLIETINLVGDCIYCVSEPVCLTLNGCNYG